MKLKRSIDLSGTLMLETRDPGVRSRSPAKEEADYDLKASTCEIGQLYPVLKAADGEIIDGFHRTVSDPSWKTLVLQHIDTEEKKIVARLVANFHRRQTSRQEREGWINSLAAMYQKQGFKIEGKRKRAQGSNQIIEKICAATGLAYRTVQQHLAPEFKQGAFARPDPSQHQVRSEPTQIILNALGGRDPGWAERVLDRFKAEYETELLESPIFRKKVMDALSVRQPVRPYVGYGRSKSVGADAEQIQALMNLPLDDPAWENDQRARRLMDVLHTTAENKKKVPDNEGYEPLPDLYDVFIQECPKCLCPQCPHGNSCIERVRPDEYYTGQTVAIDRAAAAAVE
jgi:hypothetical protein